MGKTCPVVGVGVVVVVPPGVVVPPVCAEAVWAPNAAPARASAATSATRLRCVFATSLLDPPWVNTLRPTELAGGLAPRRRYEPVGCDSPLGVEPLRVPRSPR